MVNGSTFALLQRDGFAQTLVVARCVNTRLLLLSRPLHLWISFALTCDFSVIGWFAFRLYGTVCIDLHGWSKWHFPLIMFITLTTDVSSTVLKCSVHICRPVRQWTVMLTNVCNVVVYMYTWHDRNQRSFEKS